MNLYNKHMLSPSSLWQKIMGYPLEIVGEKWKWTYLVFCLKATCRYWTWNLSVANVGFGLSSLHHFPSCVWEIHRLGSKEGLKKKYFEGDQHGFYLSDLCCSPYGQLFQCTNNMNKYRNIFVGIEFKKKRKILHVYWIFFHICFHSFSWKKKLWMFHR